MNYPVCFKSVCAVLLGSVIMIGQPVHAVIKASESVKKEAGIKMQPDLSTEKKTKVQAESASGVGAKVSSNHVAEKECKAQEETKISADTKAQTNSKAQVGLKKALYALKERAYEAVVAAVAFGLLSYWNLQLQRSNDKLYKVLEAEKKARVESGRVLAAMAQKVNNHESSICLVNNNMIEMENRFQPIEQALYGTSSNRSQQVKRQYALSRLLEKELSEPAGSSTNAVDEGVFLGNKNVEDTFKPSSSGGFSGLLEPVVDDVATEEKKGVSGAAGSSVLPPVAPAITENAQGAREKGTPEAGCWIM